MDWGMKDILVPLAEQACPMERKAIFGLFVHR
jgi:hypothetical protein